MENEKNTFMKYQLKRNHVCNVGSFRITKLTIHKKVMKLQSEKHSKQVIGLSPKRSEI